MATLLRSRETFMVEVTGEPGQEDRWDLGWWELKGRGKET